MKKSCENDLELIAASSGVTKDETKVLMRSVKAAPTTKAMAMSMTLPVGVGGGGVWGKVGGLERERETFLFFFFSQPLLLARAGAREKEKKEERQKKRAPLSFCPTTHP